MTSQRETFQSQKTQGFCVADFATLSDERRSRSKIVILFNMDKRTLRSKFEGLMRSKILWILQNDFVNGSGFVQYNVSVSSKRYYPLGQPRANFQKLPNSPSPPPGKFFGQISGGRASPGIFISMNFTLLHHFQGLNY